MCLTYNEELTTKYKSKTKPFIAYKMVIIRPDGKFFSPYQKTELVFGINKSNRNSIELYPEETNAVNKGCHLYLTKKAANEDKVAWQRMGAQKCDILKAIVKPKDVVAAGFFNFTHEIQLPSLVCMKYSISKKDNKE